MNAHLEFTCKPKLLEDFVSFTRLQLESGDWDPAYPVLRHIMRDAEAEDAAHLILLYCAYYNLPSALTCWLNRREGTLPCGVERRGLRGQRQMVQHLDSVHSLAERGARQWLLPEPEDALANWHYVQENYRQAWGNGRWAAYKMAELCQKVLCWDLEPTDMGHAHSSGPRKGLALFFGELEGNDERAIRMLDEQSEAITFMLQAELDLDGDELDFAMVETLLCDFHSMTKGRYYPGHDLDEMYHVLQHGSVSDEIRDMVYDARWKCFDPNWLAEHTLLPAPDIKRRYRETGVVPAR